MRDWNDAHIAGVNIREIADKAELYQSKRNGKAKALGHVESHGRYSGLEFTLFNEIEQAPKKIWQVEGFQAEGELVCSFGAPSAGKSALIIDKGAHIADGGPWFGHRVTRCGVLHVAAERLAVVKRRYAAWRIHHGVDDLPLAVLGGTVDLRTNNSDAQQIIDACRRLEDAKGFSVGFIAIETVNRILAGGSENDPRDMGSLIDNLAFIQYQTGATVEVVHHIPQDGAQRLRGHGALLGACDTTLSVTGSGKSVRTCILDKANDAVEGAQVNFELLSVELSRDEETGNVTTAPVIIPATEANAVNTATGAKLTPNQQSMLNILDDAGPKGLTVEEWNDKAGDGLGLNRRMSLMDYRKALKDKKLVHEHAGHWYITNR
jgi:AAA domain